MATVQIGPLIFGIVIAVPTTVALVYFSLREGARQRRALGKGGVLDDPVQRRRFFIGLGLMSALSLYALAVWLVVAVGNRKPTAWMAWSVSLIFWACVLGTLIWLVRRHRSG